MKTRNDILAEYVRSRYPEIEKTNCVMLELILRKYSRKYRKYLKKYLKAVRTKNDRI